VIDGEAVAEPFDEVFADDDAHAITSPKWRPCRV
jgi:hypothetical protein